MKARSLLTVLPAAGAGLLSLAIADAHGQAAAQAAPPRPAASAREAAPLDLTGYWVTLVYEDWRFLMVTPQRGDYDSVPLTAGRPQSGGSLEGARRR